MKEQTIAKMVRAGVGQDRAEKFYALFLSAMCGGIEPEAGDVFSREDIAAAFPGNVPARNALTAALCGEQAPKVKKYKPGRPCTAAEYAEHYDRDPENADLVADLVRATDGKPWVVFKDRFRVAESAKFIAWHMDEAIAPATILVDGVPVAPVMPGEERRKEAKEYPVDPHTPGGFLDVENKSPRTNADFTGYTEEEIQATIMAYLKLVRMDDLSLQRLTEENRGKGATGILRPWPSLAAAWANTKPENRPKTKATKAPRNPPPAGGGDAPIVGRAPLAPPPAGPAPLVVVLGTAAKGWPSVRSALSQLVGAGYIRLWSDNDIQPGEDRRIATQRAYAAAAMFVALLNGDTAIPLRDTLQALLGSGRPILPVLTGACLVDLTPVGHLSVLFRDRPYSGDLDGVMLATAVRDMAASLRSVPPAPARLDLNTIHDALVSSGLTGSRGALLAGIPRAFVSSLPKNMPDDSSQALVDLGALEQAGTIRDGSRPLVTYLRAAVALAEPRREAQVFRDALRGLGES